MGNRERVLASLRHRQPDRIPYDIQFTQKAHAKMVEFYGDPDFGSKLGNCLTWVGCEPADGWRAVEPDVWEDQFGVRWDRSIDKDIGNVCNQLVTAESLREYRFPDPDDPSRYAWRDTVLDPKHDRFVLVNFGFSLFERAWTLTGMENLLMAMVDDKALRPRAAGPDPGVQPARDRECLLPRRRRDDLRGRLGDADRADHGAESVE